MSWCVMPSCLRAFVVAALQRCDEICVNLRDLRAICDVAMPCVPCVLAVQSCDAAMGQSCDGRCDVLCVPCDLCVSIAMVRCLRVRCLRVFAPLWLRRCDAAMTLRPLRPRGSFFRAREEATFDGGATTGSRPTSGWSLRSRSHRGTDPWVGGRPERRRIIHRSRRHPGCLGCSGARPDCRPPPTR